MGGQCPPRTVRAAICDFGISRSVHGIPSERAVEPKMPAMRRTVTTHVTSSFWRAPEMWGWADASQMTKSDLKSLDVFALGLIWAGLLGGGPVILADEDADPPRFRLLEILQNVDRPSEEDLKCLSFKAGEEDFITRLLNGDIEPLLPEMINSESPRFQELYHQIQAVRHHNVAKAAICEDVDAGEQDKADLKASVHR